jgi:hypothetical protein
MFQFDERFTRYFYAAMLMMFMFYSGHTTGASQMRVMGFETSANNATAKAEEKDADHMAFHWNALLLNWILLVGAMFTMPMAVRRRVALYGVFGSAVVQSYVIFGLFQANSPVWKIQGPFAALFTFLNLGIALDGDFSVEALKAALDGEGILSDGKGVNGMGKYAALAGATLTAVLGCLAAFQPEKFLDFYGWSTYKGTDVFTFEIQRTFFRPLFFVFFRPYFSNPGVCSLSVGSVRCQLRTHHGRNWLGQ